MPRSGGKAGILPGVDAKTRELRDAHDVLAEFYAERLAGHLEASPADRAVLGVFCELVREAGAGGEVADVGCGTGRLEPFLAARGLEPRGVDLSPAMVRVARRDNPGFDYQVADLRELPFGDASLAGVVCWYSLMYLAPEDRPAAFAELARVVRPGGYLVDRVQGRRRDIAPRRSGHGPRHRVRHLLAVPRRDGAPGDRRRIHAGVLGRAFRRGGGAAAAGLPGRQALLTAAASAVTRF